MSNWDPEGDGTIPTDPGTLQIAPDPLGFRDADTSDPGIDPSDDGDQPDLLPPTVPCTRSSDCPPVFGESWVKCELGTCKPSYDDHKGQSNPRSFCRDPVLFSVCDQTGCSSNHSCFAVAFVPRPDDHTTKYLATLVLDIPANARGRYTVDLRTDGTFLASATAPPIEIPSAVERGFTVNIITGQCCFGIHTPEAGCVDQVLRSECGDDEPAPAVFIPDGNCPPDGADCTTYFGSCCDALNGTCDGPMPEAECKGSHSVWTANVPCEDIECIADTGACCDHDPFAPCADGTVVSDCQCPACTWHKLETCADIECAPNSIPTVSAWGLAALTLLLMIGAKVRFRRSSGGVVRAGA